MKRALLIASLLFFSFSIQAFSQAGQATLTNSGSVQLNTDEPLKNHYTLNSDYFSFQSDQEALEYFSSITTNHVVYRVNRSNGVVNIYLQLKKEPTWTIQDWNNYLAEHKALNTETPHQSSK